uniref:CCHC-type domain-containing protein n=1 Tax=Gopherus agassizii TaxID=38772 RepID=A0A452GTD0_9SAUR
SVPPSREPGLCKTQARDYDAVKAAILDRLGLSAEKYHQKFRAAWWAGRVRPRAFTQKLTDWATRWLRPDAHTVGQIMDLVVLEQFLQGLPDSVRVWVRRHQPATLEAAVQRTEEHAEADFPVREHRVLKDPEGSRKPREHSGVKPPDKRWEEPKGAPSRPGQLMCWRCGQMGHISQDCPVMECGVVDFCGWTRSGAWERRRDLATIPARVGKRPQRGLVDTASAHSFVQRRLVKLHWLIPGGRMWVECIHGDREYCPVAQVPLEVDGWFTWKRVG